MGEPIRWRCAIALYQEAGEHAYETPEQAGILQAVNELDKAGRGDILVFLARARDPDTADYLNRAQLRHTESPVCALSPASKTKSSRAMRRVMQATNVAETSPTVPGIRYVIDPGLSEFPVTGAQQSAALAH